ncbi:Protein CBR-ASG-2 [Caenorhabditis briggsae]|uniref:Protein CBR-ASG-2 n=2 Tax=Caenorhabditis briggsae TaxID=6238 RepID=A0AAE8ZV99_CAEBR|nr:Protein CBR-ASG-2 [Caenorhabditis briggsae]ULT82906.1 hypothetical protein L3Y34_012268 [Caenorhabditis briggsae]CAP30185.1 Protein CBR-ASG-2 [Caenorhabditis briggsae]
MAAPKLGFFEKIANLSGALYRHQAAQFPRRLQILKAVGKHELAPPRQADWPAIKADWAKVQNFIQAGGYKKLTVKEGLVYTAVTLEIAFWFFVGEMIGRRYVYGYLVPADFVSSSTKKAVKEQERLAALEN